MRRFHAIVAVLVVLLAAQRGALGRDMIPPPRFGHTFTPADDVIYLYGGYSSGDTSNYYSDLWEYQPSQNSWALAHSFTEPPPGRSAHAAALCRGWGIPDVCLGIVGGTGAEGQLNDLWVYYPDWQNWEQKPLNGQETPSPRTDHAAVCIRSTLYVYGGRGCCGTGVHGDLWAYDLEANLWEEREGYEPRYGHSVAYGFSKAYFYGGMGTELYDNIVIYDPDGDTWELLEPDGEVPPGRRLHASTCNGSKMWIVGGLGEVGMLNDTWEYDFVSNSWLQRADAPSFAQAAAALNVDNPNQFFLFGGVDIDLNLTSELWRYDAVVDEWEELEPVGGQEPPPVADLEMTARPNPFRRYTSFFVEPRFEMSEGAVLIHDIRGSLVTALTIEEKVFGHSVVQWNGNDSFGRAVASGTYLVKTPENAAFTIIKLP